MTATLHIKNDIFQMVLSQISADGKRKQKWISTGLHTKGNKRKAESVMKDLLLEYENSTVVLSKDILFTDFILDWLETIKNNVEVNTYECYKDIISRYVLTYFNDKKTTLRQLEPIHIQQMYNHYIQQGLSPTTVLKFHANVRKALQHAVKMNLITYNPADRVEKPKKQKFNASFYDDEQINKLLSALKDEPMYSAVLLTSFYGLRRSEILGLRWQDVDFKNKTITICNTVTEYKTVVEKKRTKNQSSLRTLPLVTEIENYLIQLQKEQTDSKAYFGDEYADNDFVCKRSNGEAFRPNYLTERFGKLLKRHGLPKIRFHDLRHSSASLLLSKGFSLKEIGEWLGHADIGTTANIYAHVQFKAKQGMADSIGNSLKVS